VDTKSTYFGYCRECQKIKTGGEKYDLNIIIPLDFAIKSTRIYVNVLSY